MKELVEAAGVGFTFEPEDAVSLVDAIDRVVATFESGTLNRFDVTEFLGDRDEQTYADRLIDAYRP